MIRLYLDDDDKIISAVSVESDIAPDVAGAAKTVEVEGTMDDFVAAQEQAGNASLYLEPAAAAAALADKQRGKPVPLPGGKHRVVSVTTLADAKKRKAEEIRAAALEEFLQQTQASSPDERLMECLYSLYELITTHKDPGGLSGLADMFRRYSQAKNDILHATTIEDVEAIRWIKS